MIKKKGLRRRLPTYSHTEPVIREERDPQTGKVVARFRIAWRDVTNGGRTISARRCNPEVQLAKDDA